MDIQEIASHCKSAAIFLSALSGDSKNNALQQITRALKEKEDLILEANKKDIEKAQKDHLAAPLVKRLKFDHGKLAEACDGIAGVIKLDDPVGETLKTTELDKGLVLYNSMIKFLHKQSTRKDEVSNSGSQTFESSRPLNGPLLGTPVELYL